MTGPTLIVVGSVVSLHQTNDAAIPGDNNTSSSGETDAATA